MTMSVKSNDLPDETVARIGLLRFLSRVFISEIDSDFLAVLRLPEISEVLAQAEPSIIDWLAADWSASSFEDAAVEFCRLFVVPGVCVPVASAWQSGGQSKSGDHSVADLSRRLSQSLQLTLIDDLGRLPADHISVLFEITAWLEESGDVQAATDFQAAALELWTPGFADRLKNQAQVPIYKAAAILLLRMLVERNSVPSYRGSD